MTDTVSRAVRSRIMAAVPRSDSKPEVVLRKALHARGLRYRIADRRLAGRPDLVFSRHRAVVFVHGCFWHRHDGCRKATTPKSNTAFWQNKFAANVTRDRRAIETLREGGWRTGVVWECAIRSDAVDVLTDGVEGFVRGSASYAEWPISVAPSTDPA